MGLIPKFKDIGELVPKYVAVLTDEAGDQVWQSKQVYTRAGGALLAARHEWFNRAGDSCSTCLHKDTTCIGDRKEPDGTCFGYYEDRAEPPPPQNTPKKQRNKNKDV